MTDPKNMPGAVDLAKIRDENAARERSEQRKAAHEAMQAAQAQAKAWDDQMQRAFKGIVTRPERHRRMIRAGA